MATDHWVKDPKRNIEDESHRQQLHLRQAFVSRISSDAEKLLDTIAPDWRDNPDIGQNQAFILADPETRQTYTKAFADSMVLYYGDKPAFEQILKEIGIWVDRI
jgi:hypothetical protein